MVKKLNKLIVLLIVLFFSSTNIFSQALISIDDMIKLAECKDDLDCMRPILQKNKLAGNGQDAEDGKITLKYFQQGPFRVSTYLNIELNTNKHGNFLIFSTEKLSAFEKLYIKELETNNYSKEKNNNIVTYSKDLEDKVVKISVGDNVKNPFSKILTLSFVPRVQARLELDQYAGDLIVVNLDGKSIPLNTFQGKYLYINFWSTTCKYCVQELPKLKKMVSELNSAEKNSFEFILINTDANLNNWQKGIQKFGLDSFKNFNCGMNANKNTMFAFNIDGTPKYIIVDRSGNFLSPNAPHAGVEGKKAIKYLMEQY